MTNRTPTSKSTLEIDPTVLEFTQRDKGPHNPSDASVSLAEFAFKNGIMGVVYAAEAADAVKSRVAAAGQRLGSLVGRQH